MSGTSGYEKRLAERLRSFQAPRPLRLMEVCGTHTVAIRKNGIQNLLPAGVRLISGPGCPVCVTSETYVDEAVHLSRHRFIVASFGDMIRVPGTSSSLQLERAAGGGIQVVYSPLEALQLARRSDCQVVFLAVGFETTAPAIAVTVREAQRQAVDNFSILTSLRLIPPALKALMGPDCGIDGLLLPGHVSAIIGRQAYSFLEEAAIPSVISGFSASEILSSLLLLLEMISDGKPGVANNYRAVVRERGNVSSRRILEEAFQAGDIGWRGLGAIPGSGLFLRQHLERFDVRTRLPIPVGPGIQDPGCRCGEVLRGAIDPPECPLFGRDCTPENPRGACMVSTEGSCQAWFRYQ